MKKKIITMGTALALALSMGMTVSAGHHGACAGSVIRGSGLRQYRGSHEGGLRLLGVLPRRGGVWHAGRDRYGPGRGGRGSGSGGSA